MNAEETGRRDPETIAKSEAFFARVKVVLARKKFDSARAWCEAAKVPAASLTSNKSRNTTPKHAWILSLAEAAGVNAVWLEEGDGSPDDPGEIDPYPSRRQAVYSAVLSGAYDVKDIAEIMRTPGFKGDADPGRSYWETRLQEARSGRLAGIARSERLSAPVNPTGEEFPKPPRGRRK